VTAGWERLHTAPPHVRKHYAVVPRDPVPRFVREGYFTHAISVRIAQTLDLDRVFERYDVLCKRTNFTQLV